MSCLKGEIVWKSTKLGAYYLKGLGCERSCETDTPDKLQQRFVKCIFIGYPKEMMGYYFYFPLENKIAVARGIILLILGGFVWCYTHAYIEDGVTFIAKSSVTFLAKRAHMDNCDPSRTPIDTESKLESDVQQLFSSFTTYLVAYSDADWAGFPTTYLSTSGYCVFLGNNLLYWSSKRQPTLSRSNAEAEYHGVANVVAETCWLRNLLCELHTPLSSATFVYCDNVRAVYLSCNSVQHQRTKHIEIDIHFVRDLVAAGQVCVLHVPSRY
ncbi:ribonuclease H-like domain-containing protein [Tanacetum coccineum]|uniref:Ribonuclease H-like domain-containing protein n=1 Tax=Tanacetum coccineum TaxID=301880 RepID=A0ABQ5FTI2_9ASTR